MTLLLRRLRILIDRLVRECNTTGPPCSVTVELQLDWRRHNGIAWPARVKPPANPPCSVTDYDRRRRTPERKTILAPTLRVGGPVINHTLTVVTSMSVLVILGRLVLPPGELR